jgi:RNA polymerase sigma-70 factor (ECF subfamily)
VNPRNSEDGRRIEPVPDDGEGMHGVVDEGAGRLVELYDALLPDVYGYLLDRSGDRAVAEDLTSETFLAVVRAEARPDPAPLSAAWIVGIARHKLADHWRRRAREDRLLMRTGAEPEHDGDPRDATVDDLLTRSVLARLEPDHRAALTFRYVDGLPVADVAELLDRSVHATESLLVRAKGAFRRAYPKGGVDG